MGGPGRCGFAPKAEDSHHCLKLQAQEPSKPTCVSRAGQAQSRNQQGRCAAVGGAPHRQQNAELRIEAPVGEDARLTGEAKAAQGSGSAHDSASEATVPQSEPMPRHMRVGSIRTRSP